MPDANSSANLSPSEWNFRFRSGRLCLDFIATVGDREHMPFDRWRATQDLARWCAQAGLVPEGGTVSEGQIGLARQLREALFRMVTAARGGTQADPGDFALLNATARLPALAPQLRAIGRPHGWSSPSPYDSVLATVARDAIDLLSSTALERVRKCADAHCSILFLDTSRPGKRRWCSMNGCGNKVKKARYRKRQKS